MLKHIVIGFLICVGSAHAEVPNSVAVAKAKSAVASKMRDPSSAQFRDVKVTGNCDRIKYVTGWANGKNGFGGYAGFMIFLARIENNNVVVMQAGGNEYATAAEFRTAAVCNGDAAN